VSNNYGEQYADTITIPVKISPQILDFSTTGRTSYHNSNDGFVKVNLKPHKQNIIYNWSSGHTNDSIYNLAGGNYIITVTDTLSNCFDIDTIVIFEPQYYPNITDIDTVNVFYNRAIIKWRKEIDATSYAIRYRKLNENNWQYLNLNINDTTATLRDLSPETDYIFAIRQFKDNSTYSCFTEYNFKTKTIICPTPSNLLTSDITNNTAKLTWDNTPNTTYYLLRWREKNGTGIWAYSNTTNNSITIGNLGAKTYEWQVRKFCPQTDYSNFSEIAEFSIPQTLNCDSVQYFYVTEKGSKGAKIILKSNQNDELYYIRIRKQTEPNNWKYYNLIYPDTILLLTNLEPNTIYEL